MIKELLIILVSSSLISNVVLSQFLGLCPFLGVSKKTNTAAGMGTAVIFVITLSSFVTSLIYKFILVPLGFEYLQTIVFILFIAALVQFVEMFLKKSMPDLDIHSLRGNVPEEIHEVTVSGTWCVSAPDYNQLCRAWYRVNECAERLWDPSGGCEWLCNCCGIYDCHRDSCWYP